MAILTDIPVELRGAVAAYRVGQAATDRAGAADHAAKKLASADRATETAAIAAPADRRVTLDPVAYPTLSQARYAARVAAYQWRTPALVVVGSGTGFVVMLCRPNLDTPPGVLVVAEFRAERSVSEPE